MPYNERVNLTGKIEIVNIDLVRAKAARVDDPRHVYYQAILEHPTYEGYLAAVGTVEVEVPNFRRSPVTGRREILYLRRNGYIRDAQVL